MPFRPGFAEQWRSEEDFILGITREIWEDRGIGTLTHRYGPELVVRSPASVVKGNRGIIAATLATLAEFPDRELPGEDVIWVAVSPGSFLSSHRLICWATHTGAGAYGAPTGRRLRYRILADCFCEGDAVTDEWLVRDQGAIVRQMGFELVPWVRDLIAREGGPEACTQPFTPERDLPGPYAGRGNDHWAGRTLADLLTRLTASELSAIPAHWDRACELHYPGHHEAHGHAEADRFWLSLRAAFPSARFEIHHAIGREDPLLPPRAALRWSLDGRHDGWGMFGRPTGAQVHVMGMTHAEFGPYAGGPGGHRPDAPTIRREWTLIDEAAIWKQILLATGEL